MARNTKYSPPPSNSRLVLAAGLEFLICIAVRDNGDTYFRDENYCPQCCPQVFCAVKDLPQTAPADFSDKRVKPRQKKSRPDFLWAALDDELVVMGGIETFLR